MDEPKLPIPDSLKTQLLKTKNGVQKKVSNPDLDIRSEEVQEIIGKPPHWLVRAGISVFFCVLALIFIAASFVKYPEMIKSQLTLTAINAPKTIESKISGKIVHLFKDNKSEVLEGDVLGWMESTGDHRSVKSLSIEVDSLQNWIANSKYENIKTSQILNIQNLGELQIRVQAFAQIYSEFKLYVPGAYYSVRKKILEEEQGYTANLLSNLELQNEIQQANYEIAKQEFEAQKQLADKELIARLDLLKAESELSNKRLPLQQTESAIINNQMAQMSKLKEIMELERQSNEQASKLSQALFSLKSAIEEWESKYVLKASVSGKLTYSGSIQEQQIYNVGEEIFYIKPPNTEFFGEMRISQASYGKIREGQEVLVRFSGYPYHEYGSVAGTIEYLSEIPVRDSLFFARVNFPNGLVTNYGKTLPPTNGMKGQAEIITQDMRLLKRVYNNLTKELR